MSDLPKRYGAWIAQRNLAVPDEAIGKAKAAVIDTIACMLAGSVESVIQNLREANAGSHGRARIVGDTARLHPSTAALINGTAAHALDYDDNFLPAFAHASAVLVPALLSAKPFKKIRGRAFLEAYVVGLEVMGNLGCALNPFHRDIGWHATSTLGVFGAGAACSRLLGLDADQAASALTLAYSQIAGTVVQFGSNAKPIHAGLAARAGLESAVWAKAGLSGDAAVFDGKAGLRAMYAASLEKRQAMFEAHPEYARIGLSLDFEPDRLGRIWTTIAPGVVAKRSAICGSAQGLYESLRASNNAMALDKIDGIEIALPATLRDNLQYDDPANADQARFSAPYAAALALLDRDASLVNFRSDVMQAQAITRLVKASIVTTTDRQVSHDYAGTVTLKTGDKTVREIVCDWSRVPGDGCAFTDAMLIDKVRDCVAWSKTGIDADALLVSLGKLESEDTIETALNPIFFKD